MFFFRNACCLSDKSLCSSKCAIIFEQTICSSNLHLHNHGLKILASKRSLNSSKVGADMTLAGKTFQSYTNDERKDLL